MVPFQAYIIAKPMWSSAPESWGIDGKSSHASDIWMLGLALWELLGVNDCSRPFAHLLEQAQIKEEMQRDGGRIVPLDWTDAAEPTEFRRLVEECCSLERKQRPTIDEVVDRLDCLRRSCHQESGASWRKKNVF